MSTHTRIWSNKTQYAFPQTNIYSETSTTPLNIGMYTQALYAIASNTVVCIQTAYSRILIH